LLSHLLFCVLALTPLSAYGQQVWFSPGDDLEMSGSSSLIFDPLDRHKHDWIGIALGAVDGPTNTKLKIHVFVANKGDYYEITDGLPQNRS
jgi:hypothetical protein